MTREIEYDIEQIVLNAVERLNTENSVKIPYIPIDLYKTTIEELGSWDNDYDTNGWSVDFWIKFEINDIKYCLAGSWYYGGYTIYKDEE